MHLVYQASGGIVACVFCRLDATNATEARAKLSELRGNLAACVHDYAATLHHGSETGMHQLQVWHRNLLHVPGVALHAPSFVLQR